MLLLLRLGIGKAGAACNHHLKMRKSFLSFCLIPFIFCACLAPQPKMMPLETAFNEADFAAYSGKGTSVITGQAFLKTRGGEVRLGAGNTVQLLPVTRYTSEMRRRATIGRQNIGPIDPRLGDYRQVTVADANGNFEFRNLPAGEYYLACTISWEVVGQYGGMERTGGNAYGTVKVAVGETAKVVVTR